MSLVNHETRMGDSKTTKPSQRFHYIDLIVLNVSAQEQGHNETKTYSIFNIKTP